MLQSVINSVTRNILSIFLTATLALILIYLFSIIGYAIFNEDFMVETHPKSIPGGCESPHLHLHVYSVILTVLLYRDTSYIIHVKYTAQ